MTHDEARTYACSAAIDGWDMSPMYQGEDVSSAASLKRDGFVMQVIARPKERLASVAIWGPDGLRIITPPVYSMADILAGTRQCSNCKASDVDTIRFSFAGRCCKKCLPEMRREHEQPGWDN